MTHAEGIREIYLVPVMTLSQAGIRFLDTISRRSRVWLRSISISRVRRPPLET